MNATTRLNSANNFANCNNHIEPNFGSAKSNSNNNTYKRIPTVTTTITKTIPHSFCNSNTINNLSLQQTASNGIAAGQQQQTRQRQRSPAPAETASSRECSSVSYSTLTTMRLVEANESRATVAGNDEEARTKLMPAMAIKIISVNNSKSNNNNTKEHKNVSSNNQNSHNNNKMVDNNINKSTTKSTGTTGAKLDSSMLINARNQLATTTTTTPERRQQQEQMEQQQTEHMLSITRDLNQINLKSSLYAEQQVYNANNNNNKHNCRGNNQQEQQQQNSLSTNVSSDNNNSSSNNKHSNAGNNNNNMQKQQQQIINCNNNNSNKDCDQAIDKNKNGKNTHTLAHNNRRIMKNYGNSNNNHSKEPQPQQQQQLITLTIAKAVQTETNALVSEKISTTTKVSTTTTTTTAPTPTIERAKAKSTKLTLRKSFSTPASFKIADVAAAMSQSGGNMVTAYNNNNNNNNISASESYGKSVSKALPKSALLSGKKSDSDGGGDVVDGGGGHVRGAATCTMQPATQPVVAATKINFAPSPAIITNATQRANASIEAITTTAKTTMTTKTSTTTAISASPQLATMDVVKRSQTAAHASQQQDPPQQRQLQQQLQQQQYQQSSTKSVKAKDNDNQVICANKSISVDDNVSVVAGTTTTSSPLPLSPVSFDLDLRFGCAHYKRRAMFVTPCCNKFYKCRFCHDENESHHFDRKTLTELICSECNTRQKVQEQCEACGTRFGKYTCLICNLFDDTDKKQYHCNGCGICRIGGAENFFHCKVCDMCLPIRLKIDGHRCVENISRSHCPVCLGDIHTSRIPCHIPDCGHLLHKTCFDQLLNSGHYTCPICQTSLIDMTALWEYLDAQAVSLPVPKKYENQRIHIFCNDCHKTSKTKFNFIGLKCMQCGAYNTTQDVKRRMSLVTDEPSSA